MTAYKCCKCGELFSEPVHHIIYRQTYWDPEESADICPECGSEDFDEVEVCDE